MTTECGTAGYMAPEVETSQTHTAYDASAADVWSCGVVLFLMVSGAPPYQVARASDWWFDKLAKQKYDLFWKAHTQAHTQEAGQKWDPLWTDLINKMLCLDPQQRITMHQVAQHPWFTGPVLSPGQVYEEVSALKQRISAHKLAQQQQLRVQQQQQQQKFLGNSQLSGGDYQLVRSVGYSHGGGTEGAGEEKEGGGEDTDPALPLPLSHAYVTQLCAEQSGLDQAFSSPFSAQVTPPTLAFIDSAVLEATATKFTVWAPPAEVFSLAQSLLREEDHSLSVDHRKLQIKAALKHVGKFSVRIVAGNSEQQHLKQSAEASAPSLADSKQPEELNVTNPEAGADDRDDRASDFMRRAGGSSSDVCRKCLVLVRKRGPVDVAAFQDFFAALCQAFQAFF